MIFCASLLIKKKTQQRENTTVTTSHWTRTIIRHPNKKNPTSASSLITSMTPFAKSTLCCRSLLSSLISFVIMYACLLHEVDPNRSHDLERCRPFRALGNVALAHHLVKESKSGRTWVRISDKQKSHVCPISPLIGNRCLQLSAIQTRLPPHDAVSEIRH